MTVKQSSPWSIFHQGFNSSGNVSKDTGQAQAVGWAYDLLQKLGIKPTRGDVQFIYDWELAEGGGGLNNPLNVGPDPKHPSWSTGSQYGGGAAGYGNVTQGLQATADYLTMPNFQAITKKLQSNDPTGARSALITSPWAASHYGGGKGIPHTSLPKGVKIGSSGKLAPDAKALMPGGARGVVDSIGSGAITVEHGAGATAGAVTGGLAGGATWIKNNMVLVLVVIVLIVLIKK